MDTLAEILANLKESAINGDAETIFMTHVVSLLMVANNTFDAVGLLETLKLLLIRNPQKYDKLIQLLTAYISSTEAPAIASGDKNANTVYLITLPLNGELPEGYAKGKCALCGREVMYDIELYNKLKQTTDKEIKFVCIDCAKERLGIELSKEILDKSLATPGVAEHIISKVIREVLRDAADIERIT